MLMKSMVGGDSPTGYPIGGTWVNDGEEYIDARNSFQDVDEVREDEDQLDPFHGIQQQLFDAFDIGDSLRMENTSEDDNTDDAGDLDFEKLSLKLDHLEELCQQATRPIHEGVNISTISATIVLINMVVIHKVSNVYMNELLQYLSAFLLPLGNRLPKSHNEARNMIKKLGLNYSIIPCCPNGYVLFWKELEHAVVCPTPNCRASRFIPGSNSIPVRVILHFPLIPRLLCMYRFAAISKLMRFHLDFPNPDVGVMRSVADSPAWEYVNSHVDPSFATEGRNIRFGLALDGVNPFKHNST
jgi:hypothetical protein